MSTLNKYTKLLTTTALATYALTSTSFAQEEGPDLNVNWKGAPEFSSKDGNFKIKARGRIFADWATISDNGGKSVDATEFRAARLGLEGVVMKDIKYKFEADFAGNDVSLTDVSLEWALKPVSVAVGQFKTPTSLEEQTSSRFTTFLERGSFTDAFSFSRQIGIAANYDQDDVTVKIGVFQGNANGGAGSIQGRTYAGRATFAPQFDGGFVHIGASAFHRENDDGDLSNRYRQRPHSHLANRYIDTGNFGAKSDTFFGAELAGVMGPLSAQAEWGWLTANALPNGMDAKFNGGYVDVSYIITGESRGYKGGAFDRIKVSRPVFEGGPGAWQVAIRYDVIDLTDTKALVFGGKQTTYIFGVNWHLNNYSRVMANYSRSDIDGGANNGQEVDSFGLRFQIDW
jgi:phosphate-selective porin OprO and OprP